MGSVHATPVMAIIIIIINNNINNKENSDNIIKKLYYDVLKMIRTNSYNRSLKFKNKKLSAFIQRGYLFILILTLLFK